MDEGIIVAVVSTAISLVGLITVYVKGYMSIAERVKTLEVKVDIFWTSIQSEVIKILHHPTEKERDILLEKFDNSTANPDELRTLRRMMECLAIAGNSKDQRIAALLIIGRLNQLLYDIDNPKKNRGWFGWLKKKL